MFVGCGVMQHENSVFEDLEAMMSSVYRRLSWLVGKAEESGFGMIVRKEAET